MQQPINSRLLVRVAASKYKNFDLKSVKQHENAVSYGVVLSVADDADEAVKELYYKNKVSKYTKPSELVGKTVFWPKYAEQNTLYETEIDGEKVTVTLLEYKDIVSYEKN